MSSLRDFMLRVVPWPGASAPGHVNIHWRFDGEDKKSYWGGRPYQTVENFLGMVDWCIGHPSMVKDIYYCLSLQKETGKYSKGKATAKRAAANALSLKAIWLDIDVKEPPKGYATLDDALEALSKFLDQADLPPPSALVASGGGLHVYWISNRALDVSEWGSYAEGLKNAATTHGLRCDAGITTDAARILRIPGTFNYKTTPPRPVTLLGMRPDDYDFDAILSPIRAVAAPLVRAATPFDLTNFPKRESAGPIESLADGIAKEELPPLPFEPVVRQCPFYMDAMLTGGKDHSQGLWNLAILGTTFMANGDTVAHAIGDKHPGYTPQSTEEMYARKDKERTSKGLGWPRCTAIQAEGCKLCATCPHFGKIKSPLNLALQALTPKAEAIKNVSFDASAAKELSLPAGYVVDPNTGWICQVEEKELRNGETVQKLHQLFTCKLTNPWCEKTVNGDVIHFTTTLDKGHSAPVALPLTTLKSGAEMLDALLRQRVKPYIPNTTKIGAFFMAWITELHKKMEAQQSFPFGWYVDEADGKRHGFVFAGRVLKDDGTETPAGHGDAQLSSYYKPTGAIEPWYEALHTITAQNRPELEVIVAAAFAAPLMVTTGEYNGAFSAWGPSNGFKSTAMKVALSVWGHPKLTKETIKSTSKSVINKMGTLKNIPIFWDEIRDQKVQGHLYDTVFGGGEGVEGGRLTSNVTQRHRGEWQTVLVSCSNISFADFIVNKQRTTNAGVYRIFEFDVPQASQASAGYLKSFDASRIMQNLESNFGHMGLKYAALLAGDPVEIDKMTYDIMDEFNNAVGAKEGERFWVASCATIIAGAKLANLLGCDFHVEKIREFLIQAYQKMRDRVAGAALEGGSEDNTQEILTGWFRETTDGSVWTQTCNMAQGKPKAITVLHQPGVNYQKPIMVQWAVENRVCMFSRQEFNKFLMDNNYPPHSVLEGLRKHFGAVVKKARLCAGTPYRLTQEHLVVIPIPEGSPLEEMLFAHSTSTSGGQ